MYAGCGFELPCSIVVPHLPQKLAPGLSSDPQLVQNGLDCAINDHDLGLPHLAQNFDVGLSLAPQLSQNADVCLISAGFGLGL